MDYGKISGSRISSEAPKPPISSGKLLLLPFARSGVIRFGCPFDPEQLVQKEFSKKCLPPSPLFFSSLIS